MQALILAGGHGTRLRPLTLNTPKPIVPIGNEPFLLRQIQTLKDAGVTEIILSLNYQPSAIESILGDGSAIGVRFKYLIEPEPMGTAGAYKFAGSLLKTTTLVLNGDILTDININSVIEHHKKYNAVATIVLTAVENPSAYGLVQVDEEYKVLRFLEKPELEVINRLNINTINAGIYILEPNVLDYIPPKQNYSFEYQLFPHLLRERENFRAFVATDDYWLDIGTPERYIKANYDLINGKIKNFQVNRNNDFQVLNSAELDDNSCIAEGCIIKSRAKIINSVLGKDVIIEEDTIIKNSVIWHGTKIASSASILDSVVGRNCRIGKNASIRKGAIIGDNTILTDFTYY